MKKIYTVVSISLIFINNIIAQTITNYGFEAWTTVSATFPAPAYDTPDHWNSLNSLTSALGVITCYKTTASADVHSGSAAIKLITKSVAGQTANGLVTTGTINSSTSSVGGGVPYTLRPDSIIGWYKYAPTTGDSGFVEIQLLGSGGDTDTIGYAIFRTPSINVTSYTRFALKINYRNSNPIVKSLWIISSSVNNTTHFVNSTMFVDDLQLGSDAWLATNINEVATINLTVGPNPASTNIIINNPEMAKVVFVLYDVTGCIVEEAKLNTTTTPIDVIELLNGIYIYSIVDGNNAVVKTGKIFIQK